MSSAGGPRTKAGKRRSRLNAFKHGFSATKLARPDSGARDRIVQSLCGDTQDDRLRRLATDVAEAQLFLDRIAQFKAAVIDRSLGGLELSKEIGEITEALSVTAVDEVSGLSSLKRYERNAQARWVKAVKAFEAYQDRATQ
jgi:hypothetical protein